MATIKQKKALDKLDKPQDKRFFREWFELDEEDVAEIISLTD